MHESPRTPCRYQLCVRMYACTTSTAFTLAPCWHQIRMHHINSLHFCAFASAFNNCKPNSSAKISKKRSKTFHLAVKGIHFEMIEARTPTGAEAPSDSARTSSGRPHSNRSGDAQQVLLNRGNFEASGDGWPVGNSGSHVLTIVNHISY